MGESLAALITPCGPVIDPDAADRVREDLVRAASPEDLARLDTAWPALAPAISASPYLAGLARREPPRLFRLLQDDPHARLDAIVLAARSLATAEAEVAKPALRRLKAELHLLTALADLGGVRARGSRDWVGGRLRHG